jgi:hypothetical protein
LLHIWFAPTGSENGFSVNQQPPPGSLGFLLAVRATVAIKEYPPRAVTSIVNHPITEVRFVHNVEIVEWQSTVTTSTQSGNC